MKTVKVVLVVGQFVISTVLGLINVVEKFEKM